MREAIDMAEKEDAGRLGFLDQLARLFRREGETTAPPQPEPQGGGFAKLEADFEGLIQRELALKHRFEGAERLLEPGTGVRERRPRGCLSSSLPDLFDDQVRRIL
jgi:hypothetical protein